MPYPHHTNVTTHPFHDISHHIHTIPHTSQFITPISHRHNIIPLSYHTTLKSTLGSHHIHHTHINHTNITLFNFVSYYNQIALYNDPQRHITLLSHAYHTHVTSFSYDITPCSVHIIPITDTSHPYHTYITTHHFNVTFTSRKIHPYQNYITPYQFHITSHHITPYHAHHRHITPIYSIKSQPYKIQSL